MIHGGYQRVFYSLNGKKCKNLFKDICISYSGGDLKRKSALKWNFLENKQIYEKIRSKIYQIINILWLFCRNL